MRSAFNRLRSDVSENCFYKTSFMSIDKQNEMQPPPNQPSRQNESWFTCWNVSFLPIRFSVLCSDNAVLMVRSDYGSRTTRLGFGKRFCFGFKISSFVFEKCVKLKKGGVSGSAESILFICF